ncbi:BAM_G0037390.mRNA.1.CDS.1 [Saccharomyces cerevisiae]|nr:BAM_G0037390.mRNA.1.CDS.1 [Saccharomyces cerevisiae]CAI7238930.1 BAM_G0037390.mRNA.1.CDS.1 [Saccharomyces cerevisiae]
MPYSHGRLYICIFVDIIFIIWEIGKVCCTFIHSQKFNTKLAPISISEKAASNLTRNLHNNAIPLTFPFIGGEDHRYSLDILDYSDLEYDNKDVEYDNESDVEDNAMLMHDR